jgi:hypothetical protein
MDVHRFLSKQRLQSLMQGSISFTALRYYRLMELAYGDRYIGDQDEGRQKTVASFVPGNDAMNERITERIAQHVQVRAKELEFQSNTFVDKVEGFVLSCSEGPLEELLANARRGAFGRNPYDGCVRIDEPERFARSVWEEGRMPDGKPVQEELDAPQCDLVRYDLSPADIRDGPIRSADPFKKSNFYEKQREWRIFFGAKERLRCDRVVISLPLELVRRHLQVVEIPMLSHSSGVRREASHLAADLLRVVSLWEEFTGLWHHLVGLLRPQSDGDEGGFEPLKAFFRAEQDLHGLAVRLFDERFRAELTRSYFELRERIADERLDDNLLSEAGMGVLICDLKRLLTTPSAIELLGAG